MLLFVRNRNQQLMSFVSYNGHLTVVVIYQDYISFINLIWKSYNSCYASAVDILRLLSFVSSVCPAYINRRIRKTIYFLLLVMICQRHEFSCIVSQREVWKLFDYNFIAIPRIPDSILFVLQPPVSCFEKGWMFSS